MRRFGVLIYAIVLLTAAAQVAAQSVTPTLAQYIFALDWNSLAVAALLALSGGAARTAVSLFREGQTITSALRETVKDAMLALVTGALCFVLIAAIQDWWIPPLPAQAGFIFIAGFARGKFLDWLDRAFGQALDIGFEAVANKVRSRIEMKEKQP